MSSRNTKQNRNIILFQVHSSIKPTFCVSIPKVSNLNDLYRKVESLMVPESYLPLNHKVIHKIMVINDKDKTVLSIPESSRYNIVDFIESNSQYFTDHSQIPQMHNLYKVYIIDEASYMEFNYNTSVSNNIFKGISKYVKCFG